MLPLTETIYRWPITTGYLTTMTVGIFLMELFYR